jgi:hypothetical protein
LKPAAEGHTDGTGTPEFNQKLSIKRAEAVVEYLGGQGLGADSPSGARDPAHAKGLPHESRMSLASDFWSVTSDS